MPEVDAAGRAGPGYTLGPERCLIRDSARAFTLAEVLPLANRLDPVQGEIPLALRDKLAAQGYFGIRIPEQYGGSGLGCFEYCLVTEQLARGWMSVASLIARGNGTLIGELLTQEQRARLLPRMACGDYLGAMSLSEPDTGSDLASMSCRATRSADGWRINGAKYWCTFADGADFILLFARTSAPPRPEQRHLGISAFLIDKPRGSLPAGVHGAEIPKIGYFGWKTFELAFDDCALPATALLGEEGRAFYALARGLDEARAHTAARAIGLAQGALEDALAYARVRRQFGRPIAEFQDLRFKLARMATDIEAARQLLYFVCERIDGGARADSEASMVKYFASEMAERVTSDALQILGGAGYTKLHAVERYWRDARLTRIFEGTSEIQLRIISDNLLGKPAA
jgi:alkylation response protein AidB-like acyl-CoA dehydrogenase